MKSMTWKYSGTSASGRQLIDAGLKWSDLPKYNREEQRSFFDESNEFFTPITLHGVTYTHFRLLNQDGHWFAIWTLY